MNNAEVVNGVATTAPTVAERAVAIAEKVTDGALAVGDQLLIKAIELGTKTGDFVVEQAPEVIRQLLAWNMAQHLVWLSIQIIFITAFAWMIKNIWNGIGIKEENNEEVDGGWIFIIMFMVIANIIATLFAIYNLLQVIKIWIAPKIWLIEYAAQLYKTASGK